MEVDEVKLKEIYGKLDNALSLGKVLEAKALLKEIIAPEPEIPEGCPVLVWNEGMPDKHASFYMNHYPDDDAPHVVESRQSYEYCEIDYTRKGHVIPWAGGECPVADESVIFAILRNGEQRKFTVGSNTAEWWKHDNGNFEGMDIIAYMIWPEWVKS